LQRSRLGFHGEHDERDIRVAQLELPDRFESIAIEAARHIQVHQDQFAGFAIDFLEKFGGVSSATDDPHVRIPTHQVLDRQ
jgi:hypothetical protein